MYVGFSFRDIYAGRDETKISCENDESFDSWDNKSIMQFTGLKDKNGKDIYERDIVQIKHGDNSPYKYVVDMFDLVKKLEDFGVTSLVIGNIYENGNLLDEKN